MTSIESYTFRSCEKLEKIVIPNKVITINKGAFYDCKNVASIKLGESLNKVDDYAFYGCSKITEINIEGNVEYIGLQSFYNCPTLTSITIGKSVKYIGGSAFSFDGEWRNVSRSAVCIVLSETPPTLDGAISAEIIYVANDAYITAESWHYMKEWMVVMNNTTVESYFEQNGFKYAVTTESNKQCALVSVSDEIYDIEIPSIASYNGVDYEVTGILMDALHDRKITSLLLPSSITNFGTLAIRKCDIATMDLECSLPNGNTLCFNSKIDTLNIRKQVDSIGNYSFVSTDIQTLNIKSSTDALNFTSGSNYESRPFVYGELNTLNLDRNFTGESDYWEMDRSVFSLIKELNIGENVTEIIGSSFSWNKNLTELVIPGTVKYIGDHAFDYCTKLQKITINNNYAPWIETDFIDNVDMSKSSGGQMFIGCYALQEITLGENVDSVYYDTFWECRKISNIYSYRKEPPVMNEKFESEVYQNCVINVPERSFEKYRNAEGWNKFTYFKALTDYKYNNVTNIVLSKSEVSIAEGETIQIEATVSPEDADNKTLDWSSDNEAVATVDNNGLVTAHKVGTVVITATTTDGSNLSATCEIVVIDESGVCDVVAPDGVCSVFTLRGILVAKDATAEDIAKLSQGMYIVRVGGKASKVIVK